MGRDRKKTTYTERYYGITALLAVQLFVIAYPWDASAMVITKADSMVFFEIPGTALEITPLTKLPSAKESVSGTESVNPTEDDQEKVGQGEAVYSVSSTGGGTRPTGVVGDSGIKLAQTAGEGVGGAAQGVTSDKSTLARMEPLRLRRERVGKRRIIISPWLRALMLNFGWGGQVFDQYSRRFGKGITPSPSNTVGIGIGVSTGTFIWRPWFANMGFSLGTTFNSSTSTGGTSTGRGESGSVSLGVFPKSRFPFKAGYFRNRRSLESSMDDTLINGEGFSLKQTYRTKRKTNINLGYRKAISSTDSTFTREGEGTEKDERESMNISINRALKKHILTMRGSMDRNYDINIGEELKRARVSGIDNYTSSKGLKVSTLGNYNVTENFTPQSAGETREAMTKTAQVSSTTGFRIYDGKVGVNVLARVYQQSKEDRVFSSGVLNRSQTSSGTMAAAVGLGYRINRNWGTSGSANASREFETDSPNPRYNQNVTANYSADTLEIGKYTYSFGGSGGVSNSISEDSEVMSVTTGLGHSVTRPLHASQNSHSTLSFGQSYSAGQSFRPDTGESDIGKQDVANNLTIASSISREKKRLNMALSVSDSRGGTLFQDFESGNSQVVSYKIDFNWSLSQTSFLIGSYNTQYSRSGATGAVASERMSNSGSISYNETSLFSVRNLTFLSSISISDEGPVPSFGDEEHAELFSWINNLEYNTGRFRLKASASWKEISGKGAGAFRVMASRSFGSR